MRKISFVISIIIILMGIPFQNIALASTPQVVALELQASSDLEVIGAGQKGIDTGLSQIELSFDNNFKLSTSAGINNVKVTANGETDEIDKFDISAQNGKIILSLKEIEPGVYFQLAKHSLYDIYIPQGTLANGDGSQINKGIHFTFVTRGESHFADNILVKTTPSKNAVGVNNNTESIVLEFVDDILMDQTVLNSLASYINITSTAMSPDISSNSDGITNFNVKIDKNKLILEAKAKKLNDLSLYTITLQENAVKLKDSIETSIYNDGPIEISFYTDNLLVDTKPSNGDVNIGVEPAIEFQFKYPMEIIDKDLISMSFEGQLYPLDQEKIMLFSGENGASSLLRIDIHDSKSQDKYPLRRNTMYQLKIMEGALKIKEYKTSGLEDIENREVNLRFTTTGEGQAPVPISYTSTLNGNDDITTLTSTNLSEDGKIYIKFSSNIGIDKEAKSTDILAATHLYKIPGAITAIDSQGKIYDKDFSYQYNSTEKKYNAALGSQELLLDKIEVHSQYKDTLVVTPKYKLTPLNQYRLIIDKDYIEDVEGYNMEEDLALLFWSKKSTSTTTPTWSIKEILGQNIQQDSGSSYPTYTLSGVKIFGPAEPIILNVSEEIIPKAEKQQVDSAYKVSQDAFKSITLVEGYKTSTKVDIDRYEIQYYFEGGIKKTRIFIYPGVSLDSGKLYKLNIPSGIFETRSQKSLSALTLNLTTVQQANENKGIYYLENNSFKTTYLMKEEVSFSIKGFNFHENISNVIIRPSSGNAMGTGDITISRADILFQSVTNLTVRLRGENRTKLTSEGRTGTYEVILDYNGEEISSNSALYTGGDKTEKIYLWIKSKGNPVDLRKYPDSKNANIWFNEMGLIHEENDSNTSGVSFIKVVFEDVDNTITLNDLNKVKEVMVQAEGSGVNMVDIDFINNILNLTTTERNAFISKYILVRSPQSQETTLYIPVISLRPQTTYQVTVPAGMVYFQDGTIAENGSKTMDWSFMTTTTPFVKDITVGSVPENYDEDEPIYIKGDFFYDDTIRVYFNDTRASSERVIDSEDTQETYIEVYLPKGSNHLQEGSYDIIVQNDSNHQRVVYGAFSVVKSGDYIPNEAFKIKKSDREGEVQSKIRVSEDTLILDSRYTDDREVELNLDEWMGQEVLVRKIQFEGDRRDTIGILETKSKWANISLNSVTLDTSTDEEEITISLGRVEPSVQQSLKQKLRGMSIKSDFIQVTGKNYIMAKVWLQIPLKNSSGKNLKVLRYDEATRNFYEEQSTVNLLEQRIEVTSQYKGIFVVVE